MDIRLCREGEQLKEAYEDGDDSPDVLRRIQSLRNTIARRNLITDHKSIYEWCNRVLAPKPRVLPFQSYATPTTDLETAEHNLGVAIKEWYAAHEVLQAYSVAHWTGSMTPEWTAYIDLKNKEFGPASTILCLYELLFHENDGYGTDVEWRDDSLQVSGSWVSDMDGGDELCVDCVHKLLLNGGMSVDSVRACHTGNSDPEYTIKCADCNAEILHIDQRCMECSDIVADEDIEDWDNLRCPHCRGEHKGTPQDECRHCAEDIERLVAVSQAEDIIAQCKG